MDGYWACAAAGHVEANESVQDAALREVAEELGVTVLLADLRPLTAMHRTGGNGLPIDERVDFFFECDHWRGEPHLREPHKAAEVAWFNLRELPEPVVPHELFVLEGLRDGTLPVIVSHGFESLRWADNS
jgi:8-oxo-dGTP pyrophosphatase MutT (NUDIX family)